MTFKNRLDAGKKLAAKLEHLRGKDCVVLAIPRGGVEVGYEVAKELGMPLEVLVTKKIGHPENEEVAIGAVSLSGQIYQDEPELARDYMERETERIRNSLKERYERFMAGRKPCDLKGKIAIIVDDGIATGETILAAADHLKRSQPSRIIVAVPVAPPDAIAQLQDEVDEIVAAEVPEHFFAIGEFYDDFTQVSDEQVIRLLKGATIKRSKEA